MPTDPDQFANLYQPTELFRRKLAAVKASDPPGYARIMQVIERLLADPNNGDGKMHGLYHGRFKKYVGRRDYRLIYYWCRLCRKENRRQDKACDDCEKIPDHSVIFFDLYHKSDMKKFNKTE
jgi:hypothetical protein